jgi:glucose/arabinose dehydrogenase
VAVWVAPPIFLSVLFTNLYTEGFSVFFNCLTEHVKVIWEQKLLALPFHQWHSSSGRRQMTHRALLRRFLFRLFTAVIGITLCTSTALALPLTDAIVQGDIRIQLEPVATGLTAPNWGTAAPGQDGQLMVSDQNGILWKINLATGDKTVFLDTSGRLVPLGIAGPGTFDERGLLGIAFHPSYRTNGLLYTYTSEPVNGDADFSTMPPATTANHQSAITEWQVPNPTNPASVVDPTSARELLRIDQPQFNHNGGALNFGPDGNLYISIGDGGGRDDEGVGHGVTGNGQDASNVLGAILRIDPLGNNSSNGQYGIPGDNPFVSDPTAVDEIFAFGFRNPFRFSFDTGTGDLYAGDVGQDDIEEVDIVISGGNYGWNLKEGSFCFDPNGAGPGFAFPCAVEPPGLIDPIAEYDTADSLASNEEGRAVIGGFVYRGSDIDALIGKYVFGDFSRFTDTGVNNDGRLFFLDTMDIFEFQLFGQDALGLALLGFGQDANGELYVLANETGVPFGAGPDLDVPTGVVLRIAQAPVPGPATIALLSLGLVSLGFARCRRNA